MKRKYSFKKLATHCLLYPLRFLVFGNLKRKIWTVVLGIQNSVPLYLVLKNGDTAVQVGTPNFVTVQRFSNFVGAAGRVVIVEAEPDNAKNLQDQLGKLKFNNVVVINKGAWSAPDILTLKVSDKHDGDHRFDLDGVFVDNDLRTDYPNTVQVTMDKLDTILGELSITQIDYLSVTVNGVELEVLKGASNILQDSGSLKVFSKGHARLGHPETGESLNVLIKDHLAGKGFNAVISKGEESPTGKDQWGTRSGDVFAWKR